MAEIPTTRTNADGFRGQYPSDDPDSAEQLYRDHGMIAPWLLESANGKPVLGQNGQPQLAPRRTSRRPYEA